MDANTLDFALPEEAALLSANLRQLLNERGAQGNAARFWADDGDYDRELWRELAALGFTAMAAPERFGGSDASLTQLIVVCEELGRAAAALPFELQTVALRVLSRAANAADFAAIFRDAGNGSRVLSAALEPAANADAPDDAPLRLADGRCDGQLALVLEGAVADVVIAPAGDALVVAEGGFGREHVATLGMNRRGNLLFAATPVTPLDAEAGALLRLARREGALLFAARASGTGDWLLRQTVDYAAARVQFGRAIGSFQAIQHKLAEMVIAQSAGRHLTRYAAAQIDAGHDAQLAVSRAKAFQASSLWSAVREAQQIHAGVGFILEHPLHLYFAQALGVEKAFGDARLHQRATGRAILTGEGHSPNSLMSA